MNKGKFLSAAALNAMVWGLTTAESCENKQKSDPVNGINSPSTNQNNEQNQNHLKGLLNDAEIATFDFTIKDYIDEGLIFHKSPDSTRSSKLEQKDLRSILDKYHNELPSILNKAKIGKDITDENVKSIEFSNMYYDIDKLDSFTKDFLKKYYDIDEEAFDNFNLDEQ